MLAPRSWSSTCVLLLSCVACERSLPERPTVQPIELGELSDTRPAWKRRGLARLARGSGWSATIDDRALVMTPTSGAHPIVFSPPRVSRAAVAISTPHLLSQPSASNVAFDGEVLESVEATEAGVLQSWRFTHGQPGAIAITIPVSAPFLGATSKGLRFGSPGAGVVYSHATWLDATGRATHVPATFFDGAIVLRVATEVVAASTFPAVLDPSITPEFTASVTPPAPLRSGLHEAPTSTWNGAGWTVVWRETRADAGVSLLATTVDERASTIQPGRHVVAEQVAADATPRIAASPERALTVWESAAGSVVAARLEPDAGLAGTVTIGAGTTPDVAWLGSTFLVTWRAGGSVSAARVPAQGVTDAGVFTIASSGAEGAPRVSLQGTNALVVWQASGDIVGARVSATGVLDSPPIRLTNTPTIERAPAISCRLDRCVVAWVDENQHAFAVRVEGATVLDQAPIAIETTGQAASIAVTWRANDLLFGWEEPSAASGTNVVLRRFGSDGQPHPQGPVRVRSFQLDRALSLASHADHTLATWTVVTGPSVVGRVLSPSLEGRSFTVARAAEFAQVPWPPRVAAGADGYLIVWGHSRAWDDAELLAARVDRFGRALDPGGLLLSDLPFDTGASGPSWNVASNGTDYLVGWAANDDLFFAGLSSSGQALDLSNPTRGELEGQPRHPSQPQIPPGTPPALAARGAHFVAVWSGSASIASVEFTANGRLLDAGEIISSTFSASCPIARSHGDVTVMTWPDFDGGAVRHFRRITPTQLIDAEFGGVNAQCPFLGTNGDVSMLTWNTIDGGLIRLIDAAGVAGPPRRLASQVGDVAWDGQRFVVSTPPNTTLVGLDGGVEVVTANGSALACRDGQCLLVRSEFLPDGGQGRVLATLLADTAPPTATVMAVTTQEDQPLLVSLAGTDPEGAPLTALITSAPTHGRVTGQPPNVTYTPNRDFFGADVFSFVVSDGRATSQPANVNVTVTPVNDAPVAASQRVTTAQASLSVNLSATDIENDALTFQIVAGPDAGRLVGAPPSVTYEPAPSFVGSDSIQFTARDGVATSNLGVITIVVVPAPDAGSGGGAAGGGSAGGGSAGGGSAGGGSAGGGSAGGGSAGGGSSGGGSAGGGSAAGGAAGGSSAGGSSAGGGSAGGGSAPPAGCGCAATDGAGLLALLLVLHHRARRARPLAAQ